MSDEPRKRGWMYWAAVTCGVLVLYVLSIGPAYRAIDAFSLDGEWMYAVYYPIYYLREADRTKTLDTLIRWYADLWLPPIPDAQKLMH